MTLVRAIYDSASDGFALFVLGVPERRFRLWLRELELDLALRKQGDGEYVKLALRRCALAENCLVAGRPLQDCELNIVNSLREAGASELEIGTLFYSRFIRNAKGRLRAGRTLGNRIDLGIVGAVLSGIVFCTSIIVTESTIGGRPPQFAQLCFFGLVLALYTHGWDVLLTKPASIYSKWAHVIKKSAHDNF